ncbi:MAG: 5-formyltetrahydrofolate cyclo-ligase [Clostridia bacterium]
MNKKDLRSYFLKIREGINKTEAANKSKVITDKLIKTTWYKRSQYIMTYIDFKNEVVTREFIRYALNEGKQIIVPITDTSSKKMILSELKNFDTELCISNYGILEPKNEFVREVGSDVLDLILVPGLVFDTAGYRVGYGGGYYDKLLQQKNSRAVAVGVAFDFQIINHVPAEHYDRKVDYIITDERIIGQ